MESHLLQMRGLKQIVRPVQRHTDVASFTDAWIETNNPYSVDESSRRIFYRCVD